MLEFLKTLPLIYRKNRVKYRIFAEIQ